MNVRGKDFSDNEFKNRNFKLVIKYIKFKITSNGKSNSL